MLIIQNTIPTFDEIQEKQKRVKGLFKKAKKTDDNEDWLIYNTEWNELGEMMEQYGWKIYFREVLIEKVLK